MRRSHEALAAAIAADAPVYGVSRGFGPLAEFGADPDSARQGLGLVSHLSAGQGPALDIETTRLMLELRLIGMTRGYSGIAPEQWQRLSGILRSGFVPVVPAMGSLSASGDLIPLAHAALALSGGGHAWDVVDRAAVRAPARQVLERLGHEPITWSAREALAFVNGTTASLAATLRNSARIRRQCWVAAALTGTLVETLGSSGEPYESVVAAARGGSVGHETAAAWIRKELSQMRDARTARRLQEPYSLRCAPQILGSVLDFLDASERLLVAEAQGCSDNPIVAVDGIRHAGNFYAATAGLAADQQALLVHQIAYVAERQLALILSPATNGGLPPLLASRPGATSGLAGVQIVATALLAEIRQQCAPATTTPVPTNLDNQDVVPMALMGALRVARQLDSSALVLGSLAVGAAQLLHLTVGDNGNPQHGSLSRLVSRTPRLMDDRPLADEVRELAALVEDEARRQVAVTVGPGVEL